MILAPDRERRRWMLGLSAAAGVGALAGASAFLPSRRRSGRAETGHLVLPDFARNSEQAGLVMIATPTASYHIARDPGGWVLPERGRHAVRPDRLRDLSEALSTMRYQRAMTRDERKFDRIGVGDPTEGGTGALIEVSNGRGEIYANVILGYRDGQSYARFPGDLQAWAVTGADLLPLHRPAGWLDLEVLDLAAGEIREVEVSVSGDRPFLLAPTPDGVRVIRPDVAMRREAEGQAVAVFTAAASFVASDVAPIAALDGLSPVAVHLTRLADGLVILTSAWQAGELRLVTFTARTSQPGDARATKIRMLAKDWAYVVPESQWRLFTTPLRALAA